MPRKYNKLPTDDTKNVCRGQEVNFEHRWHLSHLEERREINFSRCLKFHVVYVATTRDATTRARLSLPQEARENTAPPLRRLQSTR